MKASVSLKNWTIFSVIILALLLDCGATSISSANLRSVTKLSIVTTTTLKGATTTTTLRPAPTLTKVDPIVTAAAVRCEDSEPRTCGGECPSGQRCVYRPPSSTSLAAANIGSCVCEGVTTTTISSVYTCQGIYAPSRENCLMGSCPRGTSCQLQCSCVKDEGTPTTTIPGRCESLLNPSPGRCEPGICPVRQECRYVPSLAAANTGSCRCVSVTTTTRPATVRCEAVEYPSPERCEASICPGNQRCEIVSYVFGSTKVSKCVCVGGETTTIPSQVKCEGLQNPTQDQCVDALCPPGQRCGYMSYAFGSQQVSACVCLETGQASTTTLPGQVKCEAIYGASAERCAVGVCPPNQKCRVVESAAAANAATCRCVEATTDTTVPGRRCADLTNPSQDVCSTGVCPKDYLCGVVTDAAGVNYCKCVEPEPVDDEPMRCQQITDPQKCESGVCGQGQICTVSQDDAGNRICACEQKGTTTTLRSRERETKGFLSGIVDGLFGWMK